MDGKKALDEKALEGVSGGTVVPLDDSDISDEASTTFIIKNCNRCQRLQENTCPYYCYTIAAMKDPDGDGKTCLHFVQRPPRVNT